MTIRDVDPIVAQWLLNDTGVATTTAVLRSTNFDKGIGRNVDAQERLTQLANPSVQANMNFPRDCMAASLSQVAAPFGNWLHANPTALRLQPIPRHFPDPDHPDSAYPRAGGLETHQGFSRYPVVSIQRAAKTQIKKKTRVMPALTSTLTSDAP